jgi:signal transduction histidine kinase
MKPYSISRRLIATLILIELAAALCVTAVAFVYERHTHFRSFDILLHGRADSILGAVQDSEDASDNVMLDGSEASLPAEDVYAVRDADGRLVGSSTNWAGDANLRFKEHDDAKEHDAKLEGSEQETFSHTVIHGEAYRFIRIRGFRVVDPGEKGGGVRRYVTIDYGSPVWRVWRAVLRSVLFYAVSSLVVLAVTGVLMYWLLNRGLAPLIGLAEAATKVSATSWSFAPPETARQTLELAPLVVALEDVLTGLERSFQQQRRFVGDAAHELKTNVAVVKSSLQLLSMRPRTATEYENGLERCLLDCQRMEEMVAQMLTLARVEEAPKRPSGEAVTDSLAALNEVILELETMAQAREIPVLVHSEEAVEYQPPMIRIEPEQFKLLCSNLLMNAIQHSPAGSLIRVEVRTSDDAAKIEIRDEGDGIDAADLPYIFERFSRSDPSRSRNTGGTGLGLAICKAIVDRFNGTIEIESHRNAGTIVSVAFPVADSRNAELLL